jgi:hypothetical protein
MIFFSWMPAYGGRLPRAAVLQKATATEAAAAAPAAAMAAAEAAEAMAAVVKAKYFDQLSLLNNLNGQKSLVRP